MKKIKASQALIDILIKNFGNDIKKIDMWLCLSNPSLGGSSPNDMIKYGREDKLICHIQNIMNGNIP